MTARDLCLMLGHLDIAAQDRSAIERRAKAIKELSGHPTARLLADEVLRDLRSLKFRTDLVRDRLETEARIAAITEQVSRTA